MVVYKLKKSSRARSLRIAVYCDGSCIVTAPSFVGEKAVDRFVQAKSVWIADKLRGFMPFRPIVRRKNSRAEYLKLKEAARDLVASRLPEINKSYGFKVGKVAIRNQRSRWGSCSTKGNLNFNYKIALLLPHLADYLIVHELCHIKEFNHSQRFWELVSRTVPEYKKIRQEFKAFSLTNS